MLIKKILSFSNIVSVIFIVLTAVGLYHHEMWGDEMQHWLLGRDSSSLLNLIHNMRYEGHPILWDSLLFIITRFSHNPLWMQVLNLTISSVSIILILKFAPFPKIMSTLIVFGYFTFYEYAEISRSYSLGLLLIICCCILYRKRYFNYVLFSVLLGLLANVHLFYLFISLSFFLVLTFDYLFYALVSKHQKRAAFAGVLIYSVFVILAALQIIPPPEQLVTIKSANLLSLHRIGGAFAILTKCFLPIPVTKMINWWNSNWFTGYPKLNAVLTLIILIALFLVLVKKPLALLFFFASFSSIAFFIFLTQIGGIRYYGLVFISFIAALWLAEYCPASIKLNKVIERLHLLILNPFIYVVLIIQVIAGTVAYNLSFGRPFSQGKNVAEYLQSHGLDKHIIVANIYFAGVPVAGYLDKQVFYPRINQWGSYCKWNLLDEIDSHYPTPSTLKNLYPNIDSTLVLVLDAPISNRLLYENPATQIQFLKDFTGSVTNENYFVYLMSPKK